MKLIVVTFNLSLIYCFLSFYSGIRVVEWKELMLGVSHIYSSSLGGFSTTENGTTTLDSV